MKAKIDRDFVKKAQPDPQKDVFYWDQEIPGFGLKITPKGKKIYIAQYRAHGRSRRLVIGQHGVIKSIEKARDEARAKLAQATLGEDPAAAKLDLRRGPTLKQLGARYISEHAEAKKKASSAQDDRQMLENLIYPTLGGEKVATITRKQIAELHHNLRKKPYAANRVLSLLSKMFNLAESWGYRPDNTNPCRHIQKFKEKKRRRFLSTDELSRLGKALSDAEQNETEPPAGIAAIRTLLFSGARVSEILTSQWEYFNPELSALVLPDSKTGSKTIPLSAPARAIIEAQPVIKDNPYIFPGHRHGQNFVGVGRVWKRIRTAAGIPDVRLHDLRYVLSLIMFLVFLPAFNSSFYLLP